MPFAVRRDTTYVVCFDHSTVGSEGNDVVTLDALDPEAKPVQHLPGLGLLGRGGRRGADRSAGPAARCDVGGPGDRAVRLRAPPRRLPARRGAVRGPGAARRAGRARSGDLLLAQEIVVEPDFPGPALAWRNRPVGPFHWRVALVDGARWHYDDDGRQSIEALVQPNPGVGLVVRPEGRDYFVNAPTMCRDGVQTLFVRALLDPRARRK